MRKTLPLQILSTLALGTTLALTAYAASKPTEPVSVDESAPDKAGKAAKGAAGVSTMPSKGPASVDEFSPQRTGKETAGTKTDSRNMPNPKTPASVDESAPDRTGKGADKGVRPEKKAY